MRGDVVEIFPAYEATTAIRVEFFGDEVDSIRDVDPLRGRGCSGRWIATRSIRARTT